MKLLFVNCCMRDAELSRTQRLCDEFLHCFLEKNPGYELETLDLKKTELRPYYNEDVERRTELLKRGETDHGMFELARQFSGADRILVGAPYWDLCFPALFKLYLEQIFVTGITFKYVQEGSVGLCRADKMMCIQSAGGFVEEDDPGNVYLRAVCDMFGIPDYSRICAQGVDIAELSEQEQMQKALELVEKAAQEW